MTGNGFTSLDDVIDVEFTLWDFFLFLGVDKVLCTFYSFM